MAVDSAIGSPPREAVTALTPPTASIVGQGKLAADGGKGGKGAQGRATAVFGAIVSAPSSPEPAAQRAPPLLEEEEEEEEGLVEQEPAVELPVEAEEEEERHSAAKRAAEQLLDGAPSPEPKEDEA